MNGYVQRLVDRAVGGPIGVRARSQPALPPRVGSLPPAPDVVPMAATTPDRAGAEAGRTLASPPPAARVFSPAPIALAVDREPPSHRPAEHLVATGPADPGDARAPAVSPPVRSALHPRPASPLQPDDDAREGVSPDATTAQPHHEPTRSARPRRPAPEAAAPPTAPAVRATPAVSTTERGVADPALAMPTEQITVVAAPVAIARAADSGPPPVTRPRPTGWRGAPSSHGERDDDVRVTQGPVDVHIDTIEIVADASPVPAPTRRALPGFDAYAAIRSYDWGD